MAFWSHWRNSYDGLLTTIPQFGVGDQDLFTPQLGLFSPDHSEDMLHSDSECLLDQLGASEGGLGRGSAGATWGGLDQLAGDPGGSIYPSQSPDPAPPTIHQARHQAQPFY